MKKIINNGNSFQYDVAVIGGGSAGYAAARSAAAAGLKTVVIEGAKELGGLCILHGCMPSKALLQAAEVLHQARTAATWGIKIPKAGFDFKAVMARKNAMIKDFADHRGSQLEDGQFKLLRAYARFLDPHTVELSPASDSSSKTLSAKYFIITTGSITAPSPIPGLKEAGYLTSDQALALKRLPKSLIVLGGGPIGAELAQFFCRFDVEVTLIQRSGHLLREFDTDAAEVIEKVLQREGICLWRETKVTGAYRKGRSKVVTFQCHRKTHQVVAEQILFALGRIPATQGLGLENTGVKTEKHRIVTNAEMRTNVPHIFAAGDCTGPYEIVHIGIEQGEIAVRNILQPRKKQSIDYRLLCSVAFTSPQIATVGLTEKKAGELGVPFVSACYPFNDHGKSMIMATQEGFVKLLADPKTGEILGGACVGPMGGELIHEIIVAMANRMTVGALATLPHYHPTLAEIWTLPAEQLAKKIG